MRVCECLSGRVCVVCMRMSGQGNYVHVFVDVFVGCWLQCTFGMYDNEA